MIKCFVPKPQNEDLVSTGFSLQTKIITRTYNNHCHRLKFTMRHIANLIVHNNQAKCVYQILI